MLGKGCLASDDGFREVGGVFRRAGKNKSRSPSGMRSKKGNRIATTKTKATAGPSTPQFAKYANCFAQDDTFIDWTSRILIGRAEEQATAAHLKLKEARKDRAFSDAAFFSVIDFC
jgi:hypothetical protein